MTYLRERDGPPIVDTSVSSLLSEIDTIMSTPDKFGMMHAQTHAALLSDARSGRGVMIAPTPTRVAFESAPAAASYRRHHNQSYDVGVSFALPSPVPSAPAVSAFRGAPNAALISAADALSPEAQTAAAGDEVDGGEILRIDAPHAPEVMRQAAQLYRHKAWARLKWHASAQMVSEQPHDPVGHFLEGVACARMEDKSGAAVSLGKCLVLLSQLPGTGVQTIVWEYRVDGDECESREFTVVDIMNILQALEEEASEQEQQKRQSSRTPSTGHLSLSQQLTPPPAVVTAGRSNPPQSAMSVGNSIFLPPPPRTPPGTHQQQLAARAILSQSAALSAAAPSSTEQPKSGVDAAADFILMNRPAASVWSPRQPVLANERAALRRTATAGAIVTPSAAASAATVAAQASGTDDDHAAPVSPLVSGRSTPPLSRDKRRQIVAAHARDLAEHEEQLRQRAAASSAEAATQQPQQQQQHEASAAGAAPTAPGGGGGLMQLTISVPLPVLVVLVLLAYWGVGSILAAKPVATCASVDSVRKQVLAELQQQQQHGSSPSASSATAASSSGSAASNSKEQVMKDAGATGKKKKSGWLW
jgi:hypothetical protein